MGRGTPKLSHDEVYQRFAKLGLMVTDISKYKNQKTKLEAIDKEGYKVFLPVSQVSVNKTYQKFDKSNPFTLDNIKLWLKLNDPDYELLSTEYLGNEEKLIWRMKSRHDLPPFETSWHMFYSDANRHPMLGRERQLKSRRISPEKVREKVEKYLRNGDYEGWFLIKGEENKYVNPLTYLKFEHIDEYSAQSNLSIFRNGSKTLNLFRPEFPNESIHNMKLWTDKNTKFTFIEGQAYDRFRSKYEFICPEHRKFKTNFSTVFSHKSGCWECWLDGHKGENSPNYNPDLTDEERENGRLIEGYSDWRKSVYEKDKYACQCCGDNKGGNLVAHHKDGYHWCKERRLDVSNGVTLCEDCHHQFHMIYGFKNNTEEQWEEFIMNQTEG